MKNASLTKVSRNYVKQKAQISICLPMYFFSDLEYWYPCKRFNKGTRNVRKTCSLEEKQFTKKTYLVFFDYDKLFHYIF